MPTPFVDPGYGDPLAEVGTPEWAKRWRLSFQGVAKDLPAAPAEGKLYFEMGVKYRAWTLVTDAAGTPFPDFDSFCACPQPYGLGMDPAKFRAYLEAEVGKRPADLITVGPARQGQRTDMADTSPQREGKSAHAKQERLRAILRAPEVVQDLYREGLITQATAAQLGPKSPSPERAAQLAEARQAIEALDRSRPPREFRRAAEVAVRSALGRPLPTPLQRIRRLLPRLTAGERAELARMLTPEPKEE